MWKVNVFGKANSDSFEISVIRDTYKHGMRSYGWFCKDKLLITHNGGPCHWALTKQVWKKMLVLAQEVADELNEKEKQI